MAFVVAKQTSADLMKTSFTRLGGGFMAPSLPILQPPLPSTFIDQSVPLTPSQVARVASGMPSVYSSVAARAAMDERAVTQSVSDDFSIMTMQGAIAYAGEDVEPNESITTIAPAEPSTVASQENGQTLASAFAAVDGNGLDWGKVLIAIGIAVTLVLVAREVLK